MLVVLPFENLGSTEDAYFAAGMTEEITSRLAAVSGLGVISRNSAQQYADTGKTTREIGQELGVDYVLEGTVRWAKEGDSSRVRITPQLIQVSDDTHLWADTYDRVIDDVFALQSDIAQNVVESLGVTLLEPERRSLDAQPTENLEAYQAYLRGLEYLQHPDFSRRVFELAAEMFERAVELDPAFALAQAQLSLAHSRMYWFGFDGSQERLGRARTAVEQALALEPDLPEAHMAKGYVHYYGAREYDAALREFDIAEAARPGDSEILSATAYVLRRQGRFEEAATRLEEAFDLNPRDAGLANARGTNFESLRRWDEALSAYGLSISIQPDQINSYYSKAGVHSSGRGDLKAAREILESVPEQDEPDVLFNWVLLELLERDYQAVLDRLDSATVDVHEGSQSGEVGNGYWMGIAHQLLGDTEEARAAYEEELKSLLEAALERPDSPWIRSNVGLVYAGLGRKEEAIREAVRGVEILPTSRDALYGPILVYFLAQVYAQVGEPEKALDLIEDSLTTPNGLTVHDLRLGPVWDPIREHPRFEELLENHGQGGG
jgi:serine/threonine-protein kinase